MKQYYIIRNDQPAGRATEAPRYDTTGPKYRPSVPPPKPPTYLVWSILVTIFISRIIGIIALVYSVQVSSCYYAGNYEGAAHASRQARRWVRIPAYIYLGLLLVGLLVGLFGWIINA